MRMNERIGKPTDDDPEKAGRPESGYESGGGVGSGDEGGREGP
jgi:hypothetical protein